jgi:hypothetical protein
VALKSCEGSPDYTALLLSLAQCIGEHDEDLLDELGRLARGSREEKSAATIE